MLSNTRRVLASGNCRQLRHTPSLSYLRTQRSSSHVARFRDDKFTSPLVTDIQYLNPSVWGDIETEAGFVSALKSELEAGHLSKDMFETMLDFCRNYTDAVVESDQVGGNEQLAMKIQASLADAVLDQIKNPFTFPSMHRRVLEPHNYYVLGQRYVASLIDFKNSLLGYPERWRHIADLLAVGENVVLLANHQTEVDPAVFAHMIEAEHPNMATEIVYVAGDRVVTDPLWKPLSMGRNLFCVHSKKHINDVPELKAQKQDTNRKTVIAMQRRLNLGGALLWMAPSGGRDRAKADGKWSPDPFDSHAVDLMRDLAHRAKKPTHLFPMAMVSYTLMPPPSTVDKAIGERRMMAYTPVGISVGEELDLDAIVAGIEDKEAQHQAVATAAFNSVVQQYSDLEAAIKDPSKRGTTYVQPWLKKRT